ncbi:MAG: hypothetical protein V5A55_11835 [Halovenus sp.]
MSATPDWGPVVAYDGPALSVVGIPFELVGFVATVALLAATVSTVGSCP